MIEEAFLPVRFVDTQGQQFFSDYRAQSVNPFGESQSLCWKRHEEVYVIGHKNVTSNCNCKLVCAKAERTKRLMHFRMR